MPLPSKYLFTPEYKLEFYIAVMLDPANQYALRDRRFADKFIEAVHFLDDWHTKSNRFTDDASKEAAIFVRLGLWHFDKARNNGLTLVASVQHFNRAFDYYLNALYLKRSLADSIYHLRLIQRVLGPIKQHVFTKILKLAPEKKQLALWQSLIKGSELNSIFSSQRGLFKKPALHRGFYALIIAELRQNDFSGLTDEMVTAIKKDGVLVAALKKSAPALNKQFPPPTEIALVSFNSPASSIAKPIAAINQLKKITSTAAINGRILALHYHR